MDTYRWISQTGAGIEHLAIWEEGDGIAAQAVVIGDDEGAAYGLAYRIDCDAAWRVRRAAIEVAGGGRLVLFSDGAGRWHDGDGQALALLDGCIDIDITATPFTNTCPSAASAPRSRSAGRSTSPGCTFPNCVSKRPCRPIPGSARTGTATNRWAAISRPSWRWMTRGLWCVIRGCFNALAVVHRRVGSRAHAVQSQINRNLAARPPTMAPRGGATPIDRLWRLAAPDPNSIRSTTPDTRPLPAFPPPPAPAGCGKPSPPTRTA